MVSARRGKLVLVVGASCAGKDTLIVAAMKSLPGALPLHFSELEITRAPSESGRHVTVSVDTFEERERRGYYVLSWNAHDTRYGVPESAKHALDAGASVVTVASRAAVDEARGLPWECRVVEIRAPLAVIRARLLARGRETPEAIETRLARASQVDVLGDDVHVVDNGGALADSSQAFNAVLLAVAHEAR